MPPTLGKSQVSSVRKQMKLLIASICKNHCCIEFQPQITTLLSDLGASSNEIAKTLPRVSSTELRKRALSTNEAANSSVFKKPKLAPQSTTTTTSGKREDTTVSESPTAAVTVDISGGSGLKSENQTSLNLESVIDDLVIKLDRQENVTDLVMVTMAFLPEQMPKIFQNSYKPVASAGTVLQIRNLAKILAEQFSETGLLKAHYGHLSQAGGESTPAADSSKIIVTIDDLDKEDEMENEDNPDTGMGEKTKLSLIKTEKLDYSELPESHHDSSSSKLTKLQPGTPNISISKKLPHNLEQIVQKKGPTTNKTFKLNEITTDQLTKLNHHSLENMLNQSYDRILKSDGN
jgi:hypothetical protein